MAIPSFQDLMLPVLQSLADGKTKYKEEIFEHISSKLGLTSDDLGIITKTGASLFKTRVEWAFKWLGKTNLIKAFRAEFSTRAEYTITDRGLQALKESPSKIDIDYLRKYPEFHDFNKSNQTNDAKICGDETRNVSVCEDTKITFNDATPEEDIDRLFNILQSKLSDELIEVVKSISPQFFERLVIDLLLRMGYGGSKEEAGRSVGKTGDGGIDGIINEDRLGLDKIYVQAKRWEGSVGRPIVQAFVGSLSEHHAKKGILITTSSFTKEAKQCVEKVEHQVSLIDGEKLVELVIEHNLGVNIAYNYEIKKIDRDYFSEEDI